MSAIAGPDALTRREAWRALDDLRLEPNVVLLDEPEGLERLWRALSAGDDQSHKLWADDDLAAFAQTADLTFVTLDRSFIKRYPSVRVEVRAPRSPSTIIPRPDSAPRCALVIAGGGRCAPTRPTGREEWRRP